MSTYRTLYHFPPRRQKHALSPLALQQAMPKHAPVTIVISRELCVTTFCQLSLRFASSVTL